MAGAVLGQHGESIPEPAPRAALGIQTHGTPDPLAHETDGVQRAGLAIVRVTIVRVEQSLGLHEHVSAHGVVRLELRGVDSQAAASAGRGAWLGARPMDAR